jgi:hypothetical protein
MNLLKIRNEIYNYKASHITNRQRLLFLLCFSISIACLLTYLLTPWSRVLLEKLTGLQLVILLNPKVHYLIQNHPTPVSTLSQPNPVHTPTSHFLKIHPNIILPSTPGSSQWSLFLRLPHLNPIHACLLAHPRYIPRPSNSSRFYHPHNIGWGVQIMKLPIMKFSPLPCYLVPLRHLLGCYGSIFHGTGNSAQLCQNFGIAEHLICIVRIIHFLTCTSASKLRLLDSTKTSVRYWPSI